MPLTFNYKEGTTTITFDDLKTALTDQKIGSDLDCLGSPQGKLLRLMSPIASVDNYDILIATQTALFQPVQEGLTP